jgi:hypothetical protein
MKHIQEMLQRKELELVQIQKEIDALRVVANLFAERNGKLSAEPATLNGGVKPAVAQPTMTSLPKPITMTQGAPVLPNASSTPAPQAVMSSVSGMTMSSSLAAATGAQIGNGSVKRFP